jgi:hypothetical protein
MKVHDGSKSNFPEKTKNRKMILTSVGMHELHPNLFLEGPCQSQGSSFSGLQDKSTETKNNIFILDVYPD